MNIYPYAGFWKRALAFIIDTLVLAIPLLLSQSLISRIFPAGQGGTSLASLFNTANLLNAFMVSLTSFVVTWLYNALMESSKHQGSLGKMAIGIKVVGADGNRIGFWRATCRCLGRILSGNFTLCFGYYMAGFTRHNQTLHDLITRTYVVDKGWEPNQPLPEHDFRTPYCIISAIVAFTPTLFLLCILLFLLFGAMAG